MTSRLYTISLSAFIGLSASLCATPQILSLDSGERVVGEVLEKSNDQTIFIQSGLLGEIAIPRQRVAKMEPQPESEPVREARKKPESEVVREVPKKPAQKPAKVDKAEVAVIAPSKKQIALTEEEIKHIEARRVIDTLRELKAPDSWNGNVRFGLNLSQGDSKWTETYARGSLEIKPPKSPHFHRINGSYTYRETERSNGTVYKSTDRYDATYIYRGTFYDNWFVQNSVGGRVDQLKGIDRELQEAVGVGYQFKPNDEFEFLVGGGGGVEELVTDYEDTRKGLNPLMNIFQEATWKPWKRTSFVQKFNYYWNPEETEQFNYVLSAAVRFRLTDLVGFEFSFNKDFDNDVGNGNSKDDMQWRNALVVYF